MSDVKIEHCGPIEHLEFNVPKDGGVVILRGRNGAGKSHALAAVSALAHDTEPPPLSDGATRGRIEAFGATMRLAKRTTRDGTLTVESLGSDVTPSAIVDPGIQDPERADAARVKALLRLAEARIDAEAFQGLGGVQIDLPGGQADPVTIAGQAKRQYEAAARTAEQHAQGLRNKADGLPTLDGVPTPRPVTTVEIDAATRERIELDTRAKVAAEARASAAEAQQLIDSAGTGIDATIADEGKIIEGCETEIENLAAEQQDIEARITELEQQLANVKRDKLAQIRTCDEARGRLRRAQEQAASVEAARQRLAESLAVSDVPPGAIEAAQLRVAQLHAERQSRTEWEIRARQASQRIELLEQATEHDQRAEQCRAAAAECEAILTRQIAGLGTPLVFAGGRLRIATARSATEPFAELSHGQRWRVVIDVLVSRSSGDGLAVLVVEQEAWEGLDPTVKAEISEHAKARRVVIVTAEAAATGLEVGTL